MNEQTFKYVAIRKHPLRNCFMVVNLKFNWIPPYFGTLAECRKAARTAERNTAKMLNESNI